MYNYIQVAFLAMMLSNLHIQCQAQGFTYSTYSNPYQNSFAFATPNLKQMFTTKLANAPNNQLNQYQLQDQQYYNNLAQQNSFAYPDQQQSVNLPNRNLFAQNGNLYSTAPQQFANQDDQLRQQLAYLQLQQLQQQQYQQQQQQLQQQQLQQQQLQQQQPQLQQDFEQFQQAPFYPSSRDANQQPGTFERQQEELKTQNLLGVAYSPSTKVSQVKFDSGKLKYDF